MAELMATAEKYATADARMLKPIRVDTASQLIPESDKRQSAAGNSPQDIRDNRGKRKDEQPDGHYGSRHVTAIEEAQLAAEDSRRQKGNECP
jgi:hypothetical protein